MPRKKCLLVSRPSYTNSWEFSSLRKGEQVYQGNDTNTKLPTEQNLLVFMEEYKTCMIYDMIFKYKLIFSAYSGDKNN